MHGFEQNEGTNLKLKSASHLEAERSEILNSGSKYTTSENIVQRVIFVGCFQSMLHSILPVFLGNKLKTEKCTSFQDGEI